MNSIEHAFAKEASELTAHVLELYRRHMAARGRNSFTADDIVRIGEILARFDCEGGALAAVVTAASTQERIVSPINLPKARNNGNGEAAQA